MDRPGSEPGPPERGWRLTAWAMAQRTALSRYLDIIFTIEPHIRRNDVPSRDANFSGAIPAELTGDKIIPVDPGTRSRCGEGCEAPARGLTWWPMASQSHPSMRGAETTPGPRVEGVRGHERAKKMAELWEKSSKNIRHRKWCRGLFLCWRPASNYETPQHECSAEYDEQGVWRGVGAGVKKSVWEIIGLRCSLQFGNLVSAKKLNLLCE
jgi:hypothetical protein